MGAGHSGLAKCGYCGKALVGQDANGGQFHYYVCGTLLKKGAGSCSTPYINSQKFENLGIDRIKEHILTDDNLKELVSLINEEMDAAASEYQEWLHMTQLELGNLLSDRKVALTDTEAVKNYVADLHKLLEESTLVERK